MASVRDAGEQIDLPEAHKKTRKGWVPALEIWVPSYLPYYPVLIIIRTYIALKSKPSAPSARVLMRQDTAPQLAILFDGTQAHAVYTCQQSQFLADWQHQQVNRTAHPLFPVALGS